MSRRSLFKILGAAVVVPVEGGAVVKFDAAERIRRLEAPYAPVYGEGERLLELQGRGPEVGPLDLSNPSASSRWRYIVTVKGATWRHGKDKSWTPFLDRKQAISMARNLLALSA